MGCQRADGNSEFPRYFQRARFGRAVALEASEASRPTLEISNRQSQVSCDFHAARGVGRGKTGSHAKLISR